MHARSFSYYSYITTCHMTFFFLIQVIVIPCGLKASLTSDAREKLMDRCAALVQQLKTAGIRCRADFRDNYSPGWKFNHWELKVHASILYITGVAPPILMWSGSGNGHTSSPTPSTKFDQDDASGSNSSFPATKITNPGTVCLV